jgi:hypothetical protein
MVILPDTVVPSDKLTKSSISKKLPTFLMMVASATHRIASEVTGNSPLPGMIITGIHLVTLNQKGNYGPGNAPGGSGKRRYPQPSN